MKRFLKRIGVFGLIVAVLSPFMDIPTVEADDCKHYLNSYLYLDVALPYYTDAGKTHNGLEGYESGYNTYTSFIYTFAEHMNVNDTITIESVGEVPLDTENKLESFREVYETVYINSISDIPASQYHRFGTSLEQSAGRNYDSGTYVLHGYWARESEGINTHSQWEKLKDMSTGEFATHTLQGAILHDSASNKIDDYMTDTVTGAAYDKTTFGSAGRYYQASTFQGEDDVDGFLQEIVTDITDNNGKKVLNTDHYVVKQNNDFYINFGISRKLDTTKLNNLTFGYSYTDADGNKVYRAYTTDGYDANGQKISGTTSQSVKESYKAFKNRIAAENHAEWSTIYNSSTGVSDDKHLTQWDDMSVSETDIDIFVDENYYWPVVYNVEYKVCPTSNTEDPGNDEPTTEKWYIKYHKGVEDTSSVSNMPADQEAKVGTSLKVSSTKPKRSGYTFSKWCTEENGKGDCDTYEPGKEIKNTSPVKIDLYAYWVQEGTTPSKETGVISYVLGFAAVGVIAGAIYLVSKKKNPFKQI